VVITQEDIALVRNRQVGVDFKIEGRLDETHSTRSVRLVPAALESLPSASLGSSAGGRYLTEPNDQEGKQLLEKALQLDLALPTDVEDTPYGTRVLVRFRHDAEPIGFQIGRRLRQLFLERLSV